MKEILLFAIMVFSMNAFAQVSKMVNCTAGSLSTTLTASEKSAITILTITGSIDARDFKTIRDDIPLLAELDLNGATIAAYNGSEGTSPWGNDYPANTIPEAAFMSASWQGKNSLTLVKLPESLTAIGQNAFYSCKGLTSISFPTLCTTIGDDSFSFCSGLNSVSIPSSVTLIGDRAFMVCTGFINVDTGNPNYSSIDGVLFDKQKSRLIQYPSSKIGPYSIPQTVSDIPDYAFYYCSGLDGTLTIPPTVSNIGFNAFSHCINLDEVIIPSSVANIGNFAFYDCGGKFNVVQSNPNYSSEDGILFDKTKTTLIQCGSSRKEFYTIPESVSTIGVSAFSRCLYLTGVKIPPTVTSIGANAFWGCSNMLGSISIPASVYFLGNYAFSGCTGLTAIYSYSPYPVDLSSATKVFFNVDKNTCHLYVPKGSAQAYQSAFQWNEFINIVEMPEFELSETSTKIGATQGSKATIDITSDVDWKASSDQTWLVVSPNSGNGNGKLNLIASANPNNKFRTAKVTISAPGVESLTLSVVQSYILQPTITKLYDFDCQYPYFLIYRSNLVNDGTYIYGIMTDISYENCFLIRIKPDGTSFKELYSFGNFNYSDFISISEDKIYGKIDGESIYKINTDGSNYTEIDLSDEIDSEELIGSFVVSGNVLYGTIERIVADGIGTRIFKINIDGTGFSIVYSSEGIYGLYISENTLISFKNDGFNHSEMFRINSDGSGYYDFGIRSVMKIVTKGSVIYGVAYDNTGDGWNIFKVNMDGTGFTNMKSISSSVQSPIESLLISGNSLYGMSYNYEILKINLDGTDFAQIPTDLTRNEPYYEPTLVGEMLYGLSPDDLSLGVLFQVNTANNSYSKVFKFGSSDSGMFPMSTLVESGNFLYGNTYSGGSYDLGTIFRINKDGSNYAKLFEFQGSGTSAFPVGQLTLIGNQLYGTTSGGWNQIDHGCIFRINLDGSGYTILHKFDNTNGAYPNGSLVLHDDILYGITNDGGIESHGVVFRINTDGSGFTKISDNTDFDTGENPSNGIIISDDDVIYGVTTVDYGSIFRLNTDGTGLRKIFEMNDESGDFSYCKPLLINDELYITTSEGGTNGVGTIFKIRTDGTGFTVLHNFEGLGDYGSDFGNNSLVFHNGILYGTATSDGINDHGYLYKINLGGSGFTKLSDFNGEYGSMPYLCDLIIDKNEDIYGMTTSGGNYSGGIIYKYSLNETWFSSKSMGENELIQVYPNPASSTLFIKGLAPNVEVSIFDLNGRLMINKKLNGNQIDINKLANGVYILKILNNDNSEMVKFIKQ